MINISSLQSISVNCWLKYSTKLFCYYRGLKYVSQKFLFVKLCTLHYPNFLGWIISRISHQANIWTNFKNQRYPLSEIWPLHYFICSSRFFQYTNWLIEIWIFESSSTELEIDTVEDTVSNSVPLLPHSTSGSFRNLK